MKPGLICIKMRGRDKYWEEKDFQMKKRVHDPNHTTSCVKHGGHGHVRMSTNGTGTLMFTDKGSMKPKVYRATCSVQIQSNALHSIAEWWSITYCKNLTLLIDRQSIQISMLFIYYRQDWRQEDLSMYLSIKKIFKKHWLLFCILIFYPLVDMFMCKYENMWPPFHDILTSMQYNPCHCQFPLTLHFINRTAISWKGYIIFQIPFFGLDFKWKS